MSDIYNLDYCIVFTNELLYRMKIVDSPECPLYNNIPETIEHAFLECQKIQTLWRQIEVWLGMVLEIILKFQIQKKCLVLPNMYSIMLKLRGTSNI